VHLVSRFIYNYVLLKMCLCVFSAKSAIFPFGIPHHYKFPQKHEKIPVICSAYYLSWFRVLHPTDAPRTAAIIQQTPSVLVLQDDGNPSRKIGIFVV
jgi:hypothetical protein